MLIERSRSRLASVLAGALLLSLLAATPVLAQQDVPPQAVPQQAPPAEAQAPAPAAPAPTDRVGRLEQQIADLQAMVAALESLVKTRPDVTLPQEGAAGDAGQGVGNAAGLTAKNRRARDADGRAVEPARADDAAARRARSTTRRWRRRATATCAAASRGTRRRWRRRLPATNRCLRFQDAKARFDVPDRSKRRSCIDKSDDGNANFIERSAGRLRSAYPLPPTCACGIGGRRQHGSVPPHG